MGRWHLIRVAVAVGTCGLIASAVPVSASVTPLEQGSFSAGGCNVRYSLTPVPAAPGDTLTLHTIVECGAAQNYYNVQANLFLWGNGNGRPLNDWITLSPPGCESTNAYGEGATLETTCSFGPVAAAETYQAGFNYTISPAYTFGNVDANCGYGFGSANCSTTLETVVAPDA
ncbi:MAG: hypothetical protein QOI95_2487 [Acidimicrobiaceae bacterium]